MAAVEVSHADIASGDNETPPHDYASLKAFFRSHWSETIFQPVPGHGVGTALDHEISPLGQEGEEPQPWMSSLSCHSAVTKTLMGTSERRNDLWWLAGSEAHSLVHKPQGRSIMAADPAHSTVTPLL